MVKAAENCSGMATLRAWKWWRQLALQWLPHFRNVRICFHGGGRDVYDGLSLNQHCCSKTSTGEATYSKIKGLDDCFTEMRKSYTSLFVHKIYVRVRPKGFPLSHRLRKFSTIIYNHLWYTSIIFWYIFYRGKCWRQTRQGEMEEATKKIEVGME
jgi:hypothetical protein